MAEVTHTSESVYGLKRGLSRGGHIWAGKVSLANHDGDYINTGLDTIESVFFQVGDAAVDNVTASVVVSDITAGKVTFLTGKIDDNTDPGAVIGWVTVIGTARGYHA